MKLSFKKIFCALLALILAVSIAFPTVVLAAGGNDGDSSGTGTEPPLLTDQGFVPFVINYETEQLLVGITEITAATNPRYFSKIVKQASSSPKYLYSLKAKVYDDKSTLKDNQKANKKLASEKWYPIYGDVLDIAKIIPKKPPKKASNTYYIALRAAEDSFQPPSASDAGGYASRILVEIKERPNVKDFIQPKGKKVNVSYEYIKPENNAPLALGTAKISIDLPKTASIGSTEIPLTGVLFKSTIGNWIKAPAADVDGKLISSINAAPSALPFGAAFEFKTAGSNEKGKEIFPSLSVKYSLAATPKTPTLKPSNGKITISKSLEYWLLGGDDSLASPYTKPGNDWASPSSSLALIIEKSQTLYVRVPQNPSKGAPPSGIQIISGADYANPVPLSALLVDDKTVAVTFDVPVTNPASTKFSLSDKDNKSESAKLADDDDYTVIVEFKSMILSTDTLNVDAGAVEAENLGKSKNLLKKDIVIDGEAPASGDSGVVKKIELAGQTVLFELPEPPTEEPTTAEPTTADDSSSTEPSDEESSSEESSSEESSSEESSSEDTITTAEETTDEPEPPAGPAKGSAENPYRGRVSVTSEYDNIYQLAVVPKSPSSVSKIAFFVSANAVSDIDTISDSNWTTLANNVNPTITNYNSKLYVKIELKNTGTVNKYYYEIDVTINEQTKADIAKIAIGDVETSAFTGSTVKKIAAYESDDPIPASSIEAVLKSDSDNAKLTYAIGASDIADPATFLSFLPTRTDTIGKNQSLYIKAVSEDQTVTVYYEIPIKIIEQSTANVEKIAVGKLEITTFTGSDIKKADAVEIDDKEESIDISVDLAEDSIKASISYAIDASNLNLEALKELPFSSEEIKGSIDENQSLYIKIVSEDTSTTVYYEIPITLQAVPQGTE